ncbi:hypothetical protein CDD83_9946 [Cordyceps sp. RAO-2017]|nr:hypothetical protein CDD83_9946 [Cordyceps sp. RAO-2017]
MPVDSEECIKPLPADERCSGTEAYCRSKPATDIYGSAEICLRNREKKAAAKWSTKSPAMRRGQPLLDCRMSLSEKCLGTEEFCLRRKGNQRRQCFEKRTPLPFFIVYSEECGAARDGKDEACVGSKAWCKDPDRVARYGSQQDCLKVRVEPPKDKAPYRRPGGAGCRGGTEVCQGTEQVCTALVSPDRRRDCFGSRQPLQFLPANSTGCAEAAGEDERCMGTDAWCKTKYSKFKYFDPAECFHYRGLDYSKFLRDLDKWVPRMASIVVENGASFAKGVLAGKVFALLEAGSEKGLDVSKADAETRKMTAQLMRELRERASQTAEMGVMNYTSELGS